MRYRIDSSSYWPLDFVLHIPLALLLLVFVFNVISLVQLSLQPTSLQTYSVHAI